MLYPIALSALALSIGLAPAILLARSALLQLTLITFGALVVFQSSEGLSVPKLAYIATVAVILSLAVQSGRAVAEVGPAPALIIASLAAAAVARGNPSVWVFRDTANYVLLLSAAPLAAYFGRRVSIHWLQRLAVAAGIMGAYTYTAHWAGIRRIAHLPTVGAASTVVFGLGLAIASAKATTSARPARWWFVVAIMFGAGLLSGTRNMVLLAVIPVTLAIVALRDSTGSRQRARHAIGVSLVVVPAAVVLLYVVLSQTGFELSRVLGRISSILDIRSSPVAAQSLTERHIQQTIAARAFLSNPLLGAGPGTIWHWTRLTGVAATGVSLDTSVSILAKWGIIGSFSLAWMLFKWAKYLTQKTVAPIWRLTAISLIPFIVLQSTLAPVVEDKGLPIVLIILGAAAYRSTTLDQRSIGDSRTEGDRVDDNPTVRREGTIS